MPRASIGGTVLLEKRGWCLKKSKTDKSWARAHHTPRYFVSRGHALSYYERQAPKPQDGGLKGVINLREVKQVRPSTDPTAPDFALDLFLQGRTYVLVPQPATFQERLAWVLTWKPILSADVLDAELLNEDEAAARPRPKPEASSTVGGSLSSLFSGKSRSSCCSTSCGSLISQYSANYGSSSMSGVPEALAGASASADSGASAKAAGGADSGASAKSDQVEDGRPLPPSRVLMQGFLQKMPVRSDRRRSFSAGNLLGDFASWKRRYFVLRVGTLQWFADDPANDGEQRQRQAERGLTLTADATVELDKKSGRLKIKARGETLLLREDGGSGGSGGGGDGESESDSLVQWEAALKAHIRELDAEGQVQAAPSGEQAAPDGDPSPSGSEVQAAPDGGAPPSTDACAAEAALPPADEARGGITSADHPRASGSRLSLDQRLDDDEEERDDAVEVT